LQVIREILYEPTVFFDETIKMDNFMKKNLIANQQILSCDHVTPTGLGRGNRPCYNHDVPTGLGSIIVF